MEEKSNFVEPYKPSRIHTIYRWIDRLPGPYWLISITLILVTGLLNHIVAWNENVLALGEINWAFAFTGFFLFYYLFAFDFLFRVANDSLVEFRPTLNLSDDEFKRILFEFTHLPAKITLIFFLVGAIDGLMESIHLLSIPAPELNVAFPELEVPIASLSFGMAFIFLYIIIRTLRLVSRLFERVEKVDMFDQNSIYAISQFSAWLIIMLAIPTYLTYILIPSYNATADFFVPIMVVVYVLVSAIFWLPLRGINRKLILEKRRMLTEVNLRIKTTLVLIHSRIDEQAFENIVELRDTVESLKLEKEIIESLRTTPWKTSTFAGLMTTVLLPLLVSLLANLATKYINF